MFFCFLFGPVLRFLASPARCVIAGVGVSVGGDGDQAAKCVDYYALNVASLVVAVLYMAVCLLVESLCYDKEIFSLAVWTQ